MSDEQEEPVSPDRQREVLKNAERRIGSSKLKERLVRGGTALAILSSGVIGSVSSYKTNAKAGKTTDAALAAKGTADEAFDAADTAYETAKTKHAAATEEFNELLRKKEAVGIELNSATDELKRTQPGPKARPLTDKAQELQRKFDVLEINLGKQEIKEGGKAQLETSTENARINLEKLRAATQTAAAVAQEEHNNTSSTFYPVLVASILAAGAVILSQKSASSTNKKHYLLLQSHCDGATFFNTALAPDERANLRITLQVLKEDELRDAFGADVAEKVANARKAGDVDFLLAKDLLEAAARNKQAMETIRYAVGATHSPSPA
jgi:hypothetical protein